VSSLHHAIPENSQNLDRLERVFYNVEYRILSQINKEDLL